MSPQPAWLRAAATRAGFMGSAPRPIPAIPAMGPPPPAWPEPEKPGGEHTVRLRLRLRLSNWARSQHKYKDAVSEAKHYFEARRVYIEV